jgi:hypothetical protein
MPRKKLKPSPEQRLHVKTLAAVGIEPIDIARYEGMSEKTLHKHYAKEIFRGPLEANAKVGKTLLEMATNGESVAASIFWQKSRCGWNEKPTEDKRSAAIPDFVVALEKKAA